MDKITYTLKISDWSVDSADDPRTELVELDVFHSLESPLDTCRVVLYAPPKPKPGLMEQAAGAAMEAVGLGGGGGAGPSFSIEVRGQRVQHGDELTLELSVGDLSDKVVTAEVQSVDSGFGLIQILARTGMQKLANTRLNQVYENQSLTQIVQDLANQAGLEVGEVETGATYPYFVMHESKNLLRGLRELAQREGLDLYFDPENQLTVRKFNKTSADHTFRYGVDILDLHLLNHSPVTEHVRVYGESPSSNQGASTWHWLAKDLAPFLSEAGQGIQLLTRQDGVVRTKDAADTLAAAHLGAIKDQATRGRLKILGNPTVRVSDAIQVQDAPRPELNGLFKVVAVRHMFNKRSGFLTFIEFTGQGGAQRAAGLLGQLGGLAGGIGL